MLPTLSARIAVCLLVVVGAALAGPFAFAEEWTLVVDYGEEADAGKTERWNQALDVAEALKARGDDVRLVALGARPDGRWRSADLYKALKADTRAAALDALALQAENTGYAFDVGSNVDAALEAALERHEGEGALTVLLVGPFAGTGSEDDTTGDENEDPDEGTDDAEDGEGTDTSEETSVWNEEAPDGSRVLVLGRGTDDVRTVLAGRDGSVGPGWLVMGFGDVETAAEPWSPLGAVEGAAPELPLQASVTWTAVVLPLARSAGGSPRVLDVTGDGADEITYGDGDGRRASVRHSGDGAREATLTFRARDDLVDALVWICELPDAATVTWTALRPDARLWTTDGEVPATLDWRGAEATHPKAALLRIVRTRAGAAPRWIVRIETKSGVAVPGLGVTVDAEVPTGSHLGATNVRVSFAPPSARPFDETGVIRLTAEGIDTPLSLSFRASAVAGRVRLEGGVSAEPLALPAASEDPRLELTVVAANGNAPARVSIVASAASNRVHGRLRLANGLEQMIVPDVAFEVPVGEPFQIGLELADRGAWRALGAGRMSFALVEQRGLEVEGSVSIAYRPRRPSIRLGDAEDPRYVVENAEMDDVLGQELVLDADGGDGEWLLARLASAPRIDGEGPWYVDAVKPGLWVIKHRGAWHGPKPDPFDETTEEAAVRVVWDDGDAPGDIPLEVVVRPRWGQRGWLFVGLAAAALLLAGFTFVQSRAPAVKGTLLYTVEGMAGTVGRLDLAPVGRRATVLYADERGRLGLGKAARDGSPIAVVRPTRVGGMLEVAGDDGVPERRLLVDGLQLRIERHALRFVSGESEDAGSELALIDVPDLLGPEFDIGAVDDGAGVRS